VGFLGAASAAPLVGWLHDHAGGTTAVLTVLGLFATVTLACALFFPNREEELKPEMWARAAAPAPAE
jgi:cyanate permease